MYTAAHAEVGMVAAAAGKHLLCDKPIEISLARADALLDAARRHGVLLMMSFGRRFSPVYQRARELLQSGAIGEPTAIVEIGRWPLPRETPERWEPGWYVQPEKSGGGAFLDHAVHQVDALRWLLGSEVMDVSAVTGNLVHRTLPVEDYGIATLRLASGVVATIESTWTVVPPARTTDELYIGGTEGELIVSLSAPQLRLYSRLQGGGILYDLSLGPGIEVVAGHKIRVQQYHALVEAFVRAALYGEEPPVTGRDGRAASAVCLAAYEAARSGRTVHLHAGLP
jgi:predicted dehydrogenase